MAYNYLKNVLKYKFPELREQQAQREAEAAAREVCLFVFPLQNSLHRSPEQYMKLYLEPLLQCIPSSAINCLPVK